MNNILDKQTAAHFESWLDRYVHTSERDSVATIMLNVVKYDPGILNTHGWPEIRRLAESGYMQDME